MAENYSRTNGKINNNEPITAPMRPRAKLTEGVSPRTHSRKTLVATEIHTQIEEEELKRCNS